MKWRPGFTLSTEAMNVKTPIYQLGLSDEGPFLISPILPPDGVEFAVCRRFDAECPIPVPVRLAVVTRDEFWAIVAGLRKAGCDVAIAFGQ